MSPSSYSDRDQGITVGIHIRFQCTAQINKRDVGIGVAQNKKQAKVLAAIQGLKNIAPGLYQEWKKKVKDEPNDEVEETKAVEKTQTKQAEQVIQSINPEVAMEKILQTEQAKKVIENQDVTDCEIDDPELLGLKKHLTIRGQPLQLIESLKGKHKTLSFLELVD